MTESAAHVTTLYRLYDTSGALLYVGITSKRTERFTGHAATAKWWPEITSITLEHFAKRADAESAERTAIKNENPVHNVVHNPNRERKAGNRDLRIRDFPPDLHRDLKILALASGQTLREIVIEAVRREVDRLRTERIARERRAG